MWVILAATLLIPRSRSLPRWARVGHTILGTIIALVVIICLSSQWISPYRLIFSGKTVTLWFAILAFPRLWSFARWLFSTQNPMEAVYVRFVRAALVAGIVAGGYGQLMVTRLQQAYDGNYSGFLQLSRKNVEQNPLLNQRGDIRRTLVLHDGGGYDGQFMYFAIFDLFLRAYHDEPVMYRQIMDAAPYRYGRIGFSLLTRILSLENWGRYPSTMMWIIVGSLAAAAMLLSLIAQDRGLTPAWGLAVLVMPGFWQSMQVALPEPLAAATLIGGIACLWYRRWTLAVVLLAFSLLVRETGIVAVFCVLAGMSLSGSARRAAWIGICACGPLIAWRLYVAYVLYPDWGIQGLLFHPPDLGLPFGGFVDLWSAVAHHTYYPQFPQMARAAIAYPLLLLSALVLAGALVANAPSPFSVAAVIYAVIAVSLNFEAIWVHVGNGQRGTYEVFVMLAVSCIAIRHSTPLKIASSMFWTACACYVLLLGFDASDIWGALPMPF